MWIQGYYPKYRIASPTPANLPWDKLTHLAFFSLAPTATGGLVDTAGASLATYWPDITANAQANGVNTIVVIGGAGAAPDTTWRAAISAAFRPTFVANIVAYLNLYNIGGVEIDWEPFDTEADGVDFLALMSDLRAALPTKSITVFIATNPAWKQTLGNAIEPYVDRINLSTYDFSYGDSITIHDSPVYSTGSQPAASSANGAIQDFIAAGVAPGKLNIAAPNYAQSWPGETALYAAATPNSFSSVTYTSLAGTSSTTGPTGALYDATAQGAYINGDPFTSFPSVQSIADKVAFIKQQRLGGMIIWEVAQAYFPSTTPHYPLWEPLAGQAGDLSITGITSITGATSISL